MKGACVCSPPFVLHPFPTERKDKEGRLKWERLLKRQNDKGRMWMPNKSSRVCSNHFVSGKPTAENPLPTLKLGYNLAQNTKRKPPPNRGQASSKWKRDCLSESESTECPTNDQPNPTVTRLQNADVTVSEKESENTSSENHNDNVDKTTHGNISSGKENSGCDREFCQGRREKNEEEIKKLKEKVTELSSKLKLAEAKSVKSPASKKKKSFSHQDLRTDKLIK
jgi:hypothetical protein